MFTAPEALRALFLKLPLNKAYCGPRQHANQVLGEQHRQVQLMTKPVQRPTVETETTDEAPGEIVRFGKLGSRF